MASDPTCELCGLRCERQPITRLLQGREARFCCVGCMNVYSILLETGVIATGQDFRQTEIFRRSLELGLISNPEEQDAAQPFEANARTSEVVLQVSGMWCTSCAWLIEHALRRLPGVASAEVMFASDLAKVKYCPQYLPAETLVRRIGELGYSASEYTGSSDAAQAETRDLLLRLGIAAFLWANVMAFSTILYVGYFEQIARSASRLLPFVLMALTTPLVFYCAYPILRAALTGVRHLQLRMDTLLAMGILAAYGFSTVQAVRGGTHVYFDTAAAIVTLVLMGKLIERSAKERAARSIAVLYRLMPKKARLLSGGIERFVAIDGLLPDDVFVVKAGERVPADGIIIDGQTHADESLLTGESTPVAKRTGDEVVSGSLNLGGIIRVRAVRVGGESVLAQIIRLVEHALSTRAPFERGVDRVSRAFVPAVVVLSAALFTALVLRGANPADALLRAISVLVIACPCALGLATPLAITAAVGSASQHGILVCDSGVLETIRRLDVVVLDKTGTVTRGDFRVLDAAMAEQQALVASVGSSVPAASFAVNTFHDWIPLLAAVELYSEHPLGMAVVNCARERGARIAEASGIEVRKGAGITGTVSGRRIFIGNRRLAEEMTGPVSGATLSRAAEWQESGLTVMYFGADENLAGVFACGDEIRPDAADTVRELKARGISVRVVSGDSEPTTAAVAAQIGADGYIAEAAPAAKTHVVEQLQREGKCVAMIGDGVNDAPALAQADLGIALGSGADIAMKAAPVVLMTGSLRKIVDTFEVAAKASRIVRQNLFWAFFYNVLGITLAVAGVLTPIFAAGAMLLSSACVVGNSMRLTRAEGGSDNRANG